MSYVKNHYKNTKKPVCYIIAGPNGAGKTTFAMHYLANEANISTFINADFIARGLSPLNPSSSIITAGRIFLREISAHSKKRINFAFESTLSGIGYTKLLEKMKKDNWNIILVYLWLESVHLSRERIQERIKGGGHGIPEDAILRRYPKSLRNLFYRYMPLCDSVLCFNNSSRIPKLIFENSENELLIHDSVKYAEMQSYLQNSTNGSEAI